MNYKTIQDNVDELELGGCVRIADDVEISGGKITIGNGTMIESGCKINVLDKLVIGNKSIIRQGTVINGRRITLGREFYSAGRVEIGGGSCLESLSELRIGYWFHAGRDTFINTARLVEIGDEVGMRGNIYTHGGYLNVLDGYPSQWGEVHIGSHVWMPEVTVHPNVTIGSNVVIAGGSIVTRSIPSNCFALGAPCKVVKENCYPSPLDIPTTRRKLQEILSINESDYSDANVTDGAQIVFEGAVFDPSQKTVTGLVTVETEVLRDRLRRHGIRFKVDVEDGVYISWKE